MPPSPPAPPPRALVCVDFDGTLVDPEHDPPFPTELGRLFGELRDAGVPWTIATGRSLFQVVEGLTNYGVHPLPDFVIPSERELYRRTGMNRWVAMGKWNARCTRDHRRLFKSNSRFFRRMRKFVEATTGAQYVETAQEPAGIIARSDEEMDRICEYIEEERATVGDLGYERNSIYLRFSHARYSKGRALAELTRCLGVQADAVFAAGDNHNDLSMLKGGVAGMVACPSNAVEPVKSVVRDAGGFVASDGAGRGTLEALKHFFTA